MSFELYINPLEGSTGVTRQELRRIFGTAVIEEEPDYWRLEFGSSDSGCHLALIPGQGDGKRVFHFVIHRPTGGPLFFECLFTLLQEGGMFLYWPGSPPLVVKADEAGCVPKEVIKVLGPPIHAQNAQEIPDHIAQYP